MVSIERFFFKHVVLGIYFNFFQSLSFIISIKQLSATTAERIGVCKIGVMLQFSGSTTPIGANGAIALHLLVVFNCKINFKFETLNTTNRCGVTTPIAPLQSVLLYLYHQ